MMAQSALCADFRVKDIIVDSSDRFILIKGQGSFKENLQTIEMPNENSTSVRLLNNATTFTITAPARYVVDIPNAILEGSNRTYKINNSTVLQSVHPGLYGVLPHGPGSLCGIPGQDL